MMNVNKTSTKREVDLQFLSVNQQIEGFPGKLTRAVIGHRPNMKRIAESARNFGAQLPTRENRQRAPHMPRG